MGKSKITKDCPFCGASVNKGNFKKHLLKVHGQEDEKKFEDKGILKPTESVDRKRQEKDGIIRAEKIRDKKRRKLVTVLLVILIVISVISIVIYQYPKSFGIGLEPPGTPTGLITAAEDGYVDLSWHPPVDDGGALVTGYNIYRGETSGAESILKNLAAKQYYRDSSVTNGHVYYYMVSAMNKIGESVKSREVSAKPMSSQGTKSVAVMTTSMGVIKIELDTPHAPTTAGNFINLAKAEYFNGLIFHRIVKNFVIQGGGFYPSGSQKNPPPSIPWESTGLLNKKYTIAMARSGDPNTESGSSTATSQFFINTGDNGGLDSYTYPFVVFGKVIEGFSIVDTINALSNGSHNGMDNWPDTPPVINSVIIQ